MVNGNKTLCYVQSEIHIIETNFEVKSTINRQDYGWSHRNDSSIFLFKMTSLFIW